MPHYIAVIHKDAGSAYGISFPDLPGRFSAADTEAGVMPNAMEAPELWFEDETDRPAPTGVETLRSDPQIAAGPADGAYLMAIPHRRNGGRSRRVNNTPNKGLPELVDKEVARRRTTRSAGCPEGLTLAKQPSLLRLWHCFAFHFSNEKRNGTLRLRRSGACKALANWPCASWA